MEQEVLQVKKAGDFHYNIFFEKSFEKLSEKLNALNKKGRKICIVTDSNVAPLYLDAVEKELKKTDFIYTSYVLPAGEANKNLKEIEGIYEHLIVNHFDRGDLLAALGGGVVGDMTGFTAATYLRGIDFVQIPTTLLAQVDSSIGGKTGVDFGQYKNMVGAFHQPLFVYANVQVLKTLPETEFISGMGEVVKHGFIRSKDYSQWLLDHKQEITERQPAICQEMIYKSCVIKKTVVENDPLEHGERAVLNFGHTIGHAVEKLKDFSLHHGHCVAIGCAAAAYLSLKKGFLSKEEYMQVLTESNAFHLPVKVSGLSCEDILMTTKSDKKMDKGHIRFILLQGCGNAVIDTSLSDEDLTEAITEICKENKEAAL